MAYYFFGNSKPEQTLGLLLTTKGEQELADRKTRWEKITTDISVAFVSDVKAALFREVALHPNKKTFTFDPDEIVTDSKSYSKKIFEYVCGPAEKWLLADEVWTLMHKALRPALENQDVELLLDDDRNIFVISFENAKQTSEKRTEAKQTSEAKQAN